MSASRVTSLSCAVRTFVRASCLAVPLAIAPGWSSVIAAGIASQQVRQFDIPAGPLTQAIGRFVIDSGIFVSADGALTRDRSTPGVQGQHTASEALALMLTGTGLRAVAQADGTFALQTAAAADVAQMRKIAVQADEFNEGADPGRTEGSDSYTTRSTNTAFKIPLSLRETPQTVTVVPQAVIRDYGLTDIRQVMLFTPGVAVSAERGPQSYYFEARGESMQVQYDGVPSSNRFGGRGTGLTFDSAIVDRIEVLHGASGLLTGPGSPGGTVNVVRKLPTGQGQVAMEASVDSWGGWRGMADVSGPLGDSGFGGRLVGVYENQDFYIDYTGAKHSLVYGVLGKSFGDATQMYLGVNLEQIDDGSYGAHYGLPAQVDGTPFDISRKKNLGATWADQDDSLNTAFLRVQHEFSPHWSLHGILTYEDYDTSQLEGVVYYERDPEQLDTLYFGPNIEDWGYDTRAADLYVQGRFALFGREHDLMFGFNGMWRDETGAGYYTSEPSAIVDIDTWDARNAPSPYALPFDGYSYSGEYEQYGIFAGTRLSLADPLHLIVGTRLSWVEQSWDGVTDSKEDGVDTLYGGVVWDFAQNWSAYASYSDIFEPHPIYVRDRNGNVLEPKVGRNIEGGLKFEAFEGRLNAALAIFRLDQTNLAEPDYAAEVPGICGGEVLDACSKASGLVRNEGFEFSISGEIARGWQVYGGYTNFKRKYQQDDPYGTKTPSEFLQLATSYASSDDRWSFGATARWQEATAYEGVLYFMPEQAFRTAQDAYTIVGLYGGYRINDTLRLSLNVDNLFDEKYYSGLEWSLGGMVYGDARQISMTLRAGF